MGVFPAEREESQVVSMVLKEGLERSEYDTKGFGGLEGLERRESGN
jgi:hypothetical protein